MSRKLGEIAVLCFLSLLVCLAVSVQTAAQAVNVTIQGRVYDTTGAVVPQATVAAQNEATGLSRTATSNANGDYQLAGVPAGDYTINVEKQGFEKSSKKLHVDVGAAVSLDFSLRPGQVQTQVEVQDVGEVAEPTRTMVSSVIDQQKIENLPVNGREFIDFALLAPGVTIGNTTSGSTDVIVEPVTKLSFAGQ
ncbi:MAG TPA: carboxypeptidase-like regulatory domain-containing protein, partial [Terriglobales bacterium]|nr:carboxypeptidase-like regulatory domain-containing protein [Terriglobales bacterium]